MVSDRSERTSSGFEFLEGAIRNCSTAAEYVAGFFIMLLVAVSVGATLSRYIINFVPPDSFDFVRLLLGIAVFWSISVSCLRDDHIRGDLLGPWVRPDVMRLINFLAQIVLVVAMAVLAWRLGAKVIDVYTTGQETAELRLKIWPFYLAAWIATPIAIVGAIYQSIRALREEANPPNEAFDAL